MKFTNRYNKFILYSNAPFCAYGHEVIRAPYRRRRMLLRLFFSRGGKYFPQAA